MSNAARVTLLGTILSACFCTQVVVAEEITFKDHNEFEVSLEQTPKRIATVATLADNMVIALDGHADRLVGTPDSAKKHLTEGIIGTFFPDVKNVSSKVIGDSGQPNIEELLKLEPGIVLQWARKEKSIEAMRQAGLSVAGLKYKTRGMPQAWLTTLGEIMDQSERAASFLAWHEQVYEEITAKTNALTEEEKPSVLYMTHENRVGGLKSHFQFYIETAGGVNAASLEQQFVETDPELVLKWDPDVIWIFGFNHKFTPESIYSNPIFADLKAVKNDRIYKVPTGGSRWDGPSQEIGLSLEWFTRTLHPDMVTGSFREKIKAAYPALYNHTPTDAQIDKILHAEMNKDSLYYAKLLD